MNSFITVRDRIRKFILSKEMLFLKLWNMLIALAGTLIISTQFGYQKQLGHVWVAILISLVCAFLPLSGVSLVLVLYLAVNLAALNTQVALFYVGFVVLGYLICAYFHSKNTYNLVTVPICFFLHTPYSMALGSGLMCKLNELTSVVCGSAVSYYLFVIKHNASDILDETTDVSIPAMLSEQMFKNKMFYFYIAAMVAMFLVVYFLRSADIHTSWLIAVVSGIFVEFAIMLSGYLLNSQKGEILGLVIGNIIAFVVGIILNYFIMDLDYSRIEKVQFEDDDYYYYVTAVPKIRIVDEEKQVKTF